MEKKMKNNINLKEINMKTTLSTVLAVVVLVASANSTARWHNPTQSGASNHGHTMEKKSVDHSKMSACEHAMMNMDHSKMSESEHADMKKCDAEKADMKGMDHSEMEMDHSKMEMGHH